MYSFFQDMLQILHNLLSTAKTLYAMKIKYNLHFAHHSHDEIYIQTKLWLNLVWLHIL